MSRPPRKRKERERSLPLPNGASAAAAWRGDGVEGGDVAPAPGVQGRLERCPVTVAPGAVGGARQRAAVAGDARALANPRVAELPGAGRARPLGAGGLRAVRQ